MTDKISNIFKLSEHLRLGKFMSIGHIVLLFATSSSFTILCIIYCLSVFSEETRLRYHLFGMMGIIFVILSAFLLHFLLAKIELSNFLPHRRNIVFFYILLTSLYYLFTDIFVYRHSENPGTMIEFALKTNLALVGIASSFLYLFLWYFDEYRSSKITSTYRKSSDYRLLLVFLGLLLIIPAISFGIPKLYRSHQEKEMLDNLETNVQTKTLNIENWLEEQRNIGSVVLSSSFFRQSFEKWRFENNAIAKLNVIDFLTTLKKAQQYKSIKIIDSKGNELLSLGENLTLAINNRQSLLELMNRPYV